MSPSPDRLPQSPNSSVPNQPPTNDLPNDLPPAASESNQEASPLGSSEPALDGDSSTGVPSTDAPLTDAPKSAPLEPKRPLMRPVNRPQPPSPPVSPQKPLPVVVSAPAVAVVEQAADGPSESDAGSLSDQVTSRMQPIPPPSEPKQYRAIGLVRGRYTPSEEQFTRGQMTTADGAEIEAVLLGRVMSLVRNHLDLEQDHLWVVYPRTREPQESLHVQIVGVWEPEKLNRNQDSEEESAETKAESAESTEAPLSPGYDDDYFSVRGEVVFYEPDAKQVIVKIQQAARKTSDKPKAFKVKLEGTLDSAKTLGYFWELHVKRIGSALVITEGKAIGLIPPKKKSKTDFRKERRPFKKGPPRSGGARPAAPAGSAPRREPIPKPVKRHEQSGEG